MIDKSIIAFFSLIIIQTTGSLAIKFSQVDGEYKYNVAGMYSVSELMKLLISLSMLIYVKGSFKEANEDVIKCLSVNYNYILILGFSYAINNNISLYIFYISDPATFSLFRIGTTSISALISYFIYKKKG